MDRYICAFSTKSLPGCLKIVDTTRTPEIRLKEHNAYTNRCKFTTNNIYYDYDYDFIEYSGPAISEWEMLYTKKVDHPMRIERILHELISPYNDYVGSCREIFRMTVKQLRHYMRLAHMVAEQIEEAEEEFSKKNIKECVEWVKSIEDENDNEDAEDDQYDEDDDEDRAIMIARAEAKRDAEILAEHKATMKARAKASAKASAIAEKKILAERKARIEALAEANSDPKEIFVGKRSYIYQ
jgi:hypothetical protein